MSVSRPVFVIQHHLATADHYDFRLEIGGVLVSWAVPKGPSVDPAVRRMAKRTSDHSLDYGGYEGVLSVQRRGGGVVQLWDRGHFDNVSTEDGAGIDAEAALARGHLSIGLDGHKLHGGFSLIRTRSAGEGMWLLLKKRDAHADPIRNPTADEPTSVATGRTLAEIEAAGAS